MECEQPGDMIRIQQGYNSDEDFEMKSEDIEWVGQGKHERGRTFYTGVNVDGLELSNGIQCLLRPSLEGSTKWQL